MTTQELKNCKWKNVDELQIKQIMDACNHYGMKGIYDEISEICKTTSSLLGIPHSEVFEVFKRKNVVFYHLLKTFQRDFILYEVADLTPALSALVVPEMLQESKAVACLKLFFSLSADEKNDVMEGLRLYASSKN